MSIDHHKSSEDELRRPRRWRAWFRPLLFSGESGITTILGEAPSPAVRVVLPRKPLTLALKTLLAVAAVLLVVLESKTSWLQSRVFAAVARRMTYSLQPGPGSVRYAATGPYDERLGYARVPDLARKLTKGPFRIEAQARTSAWMSGVTRFGIFPIYREKSQAGLRIVDRSGLPLFGARYPNRVYGSFSEVPPGVVYSLLFVENREILDSSTPYRNPAIEWDRLGKAVFDMGRKQLSPAYPGSGGSTLATQIEKIRHSPEGRTGSIADKFRQMLSASLRAYQNGEETFAARKQITCDYLNSLPLASLGGYGEVLGLGDGLWAWFDADFNETNRLLRLSDEQAADPDTRRRRAMAYREVLSLLLAVNRPSHYLQRARGDLHVRVDHYLRMLADAGLIPPRLRDDAMPLRPVFRDRAPDIALASFAERKATDSIRTSLLSLLDVESTYQLDRMDLIVEASLDRGATQAATSALRKLTEREYAAAAGVVGHQMLPSEGLESVIYSFTLYEVGDGANLLRVQADNYDRPLNINQGTRLELGSTAKLRTLATYLEVIAELHAQGRQDPSKITATDPLSQWAAEYLTTATDTSLPGMLEAAMTRKYPAAPWEPFFTGGGLQYFANFDPSDNGRNLTLREAFQKSTNLVFIRLMRDIVQYHWWRRAGTTPAVLEDIDHPRRAGYLNRFVEYETEKYLIKFYNRYKGLSADDTVRRLLSRMRPTPYRMATAFRSIRPDDSLENFRAFLTAALPRNTVFTDGWETMYEKYGPAKFNLSDRGYLSRIHPLELWLLAYLQRNPKAGFDQIQEAVKPELPEVYRWLLKGRHKHAQDLRIRMMLEADAFQEIFKVWKRHGYPFPSLVPSYATAIGSSGDNPAALAELAGIILNGGVRYPMQRLQRMRFAQATPVETVVSSRAATPERAMPAEVAAVLKSEMGGVVEFGTARRAFQSVVLDNGRILRVAGKTGTGDNRLESFDENGYIIRSKVMSRTAAFVFLIGDRYFGTIIAYVPGKKAEAHSFTSALPVQIFRHLVPAMKPVIDGKPGAGPDSKLARTAPPPAVIPKPN